ncbi:MAG: fluoride efflux transporter CrcB [Pirellulales bacterium]
MFKLLLIAVGGSLGALARYGLSGFVQKRVEGAFPAGTLAVNLAGCLAIGIILSLVEDRQFLSTNARVFLTVGFLGAFTTFSAFGYETIELLRDDNLGLAFWNVGTNVVLGLAAVKLGQILVRVTGV